jgi:hypothetical protein
VSPRRRQPLNPVKRRWTIQRATGIGVVAGFAALVLRLFYPGWPGAVGPFFLAACAVAAFCGLSILWITAVDRLRYGRRGERLVPLRTFDIALALFLTVPSLWTIWIVLGER